MIHLTMRKWGLSRIKELTKALSYALQKRKLLKYLGDLQKLCYNFANLTKDREAKEA